MPELFDFDRQRQTVEHIDVDPMSGKAKIRKVQRCDGILDALHNVRQHTKPAKEFRHIGSIPTVLAAQWARECGFPIGTAGFAEYAKRKLRDSDFAYLRAHPL